MEQNFEKQAEECWRQATREKAFPDNLEQCGKLLQKWADSQVGNTKKKINVLSKEIDQLRMNEDMQEEDEILVQKEKELEIYFYRKKFIGSKDRRINS